MSLFRFSFSCLLWLLVPWSLASCGIRLPDSPGGVQRTAVSLASESPVFPAAPPSQSQEPDVLIWLLADNLHTGMVFPYDWLLESGFIPPSGFGRPRYVSMSWGNRTAYEQQRWLTPWQVYRALFTPSPSVMELIPFDGQVSEVFPNQRIWRHLTPRENGPALAAFLNSCNRPGPDGRPIVLASSGWGEGVLLDSRHHYFFPRICNIWTAQAIEAAGGTMHPWFAISANGLSRQAELPGNDYEKIWNGREKPPAAGKPATAL